MFGAGCFYHWNDHMHWNDVRPLSETLASVYRVYMAHCNHAAPMPEKCTAKWMLASAADCRLALTWNWVCIVLTCSGRKHYLKIVMKIE